MHTRSGPFDATLDAALRHSLSYLSALDGAHVGATADSSTLRARIDGPLPDGGLPPDRVLDELVRDVDGGLSDTAGGRFFGWVIGSALPAALGADWLTSVWDQNACHSACSLSAAVVEQTTGRWLKELLHLPSEASFALVTGCQMAHVTCLAAARQGVLARHGWDVGTRGLFGRAANPRNRERAAARNVRARALAPRVRPCQPHVPAHRRGREHARRGAP